MKIENFRKQLAVAFFNGTRQAKLNLTRVLKLNISSPLTLVHRRNSQSPSPARKISLECKVSGKVRAGLATLGRHRT